MSSRIAVTSLLAWLLPMIANVHASNFRSKGFLSDDLPYHGAFQDDVMPICGGEASAEEVAAIRRTLEPMWRTLPKMTSNRIDRRSFRYLAYRHFMQASSLIVKGFEPSRLVNDSHWGVADILSQFAPEFVGDVLESDHAKRHGFSLTEAVNMVALLDQLIRDSEGELLSKVYRDRLMYTEDVLGVDDLNDILESYMVEWIVEGDDEDMQILISNKSLVAEVVPHYDDLAQFIHGLPKSLDHARFLNMKKGSSRRAWDFKYTFEDAHAIVGGITNSFHSYWQSECEHMKDILALMDTHHTGRVPLSKLYGRAIDNDWRFSESEGYLRDLGALDESSSQLGIQVIIPNYIQSTSNCIVSTPHYFVCCRNDCEQIIAEIEDHIQAPTANARDVLDIVGNVTVHYSVDDEHTPSLPGKLTDLLEQIANTAGGKVPLHGRLFAQWLHYAFPRDCPFPHKSGMVSVLTPTEYGDDHAAKDTEMEKHAANTTDADTLVRVTKDELDWMSQWSWEEEIIVDYSSEMSNVSLPRMLLGMLGLVLLAAGISTGSVTLTTKTSQTSKNEQKFMV